MVKRFLFPLGITASLASCSVLIDVDGKQCKVDADCAGIGPEGSVCEQSLCVVSSLGGEAGSSGVGGSGGEDDPLSCMGRQASDAPTVKYSFAPIFANAPKDPQPFSIRACGQLDLDCDNPLVGPVEVTAGEPRDFELPRGFAGFFEISNPDTLPGLLFLGRPVIEDTVGWNVTMPDEGLVVQLALATQQQVDPELGIVLSVARDCSAAPLSGVTFDNSEGGLGFYIIGNLPNTTITETGPQGAAGYVNVPISTTILSGTHASGTKLGPVSVRVKPGYISLAEIFP
jgi:hypothetical protein